MYTGASTYELQNADHTARKMLGKVLKTQKELKHDTYVGFYVPKVLPLMDASFGPTDKTENIDSSIFANSGKTKPKVASTLPVANYIKCKYTGYSNISQPIIALAETAWIYFLDGDPKKPYYTNENPEERKRKTDHLEIFVYGKPDVDDIPDDYYKITISTRDKYLNIHTSKENGEPYTYDFKIDTKKGEVTLTDDKKNFFKLETAAKRFTLQNQSMSQIIMEDRDIKSVCLGKYSIDCMEYTLNAKISIDRKAGATITDTAPKIDFNGTAMVTTTTVMKQFQVSGMLNSVAPINMFTVMANINSIIIQAAFMSSAAANINAGIVKAPMFITT